MVNATWFVRSDGKIRGPFEALHLHQMLQRGLLLWHHELSENRRLWVKAQDHPIFEGLAPRDEDELTIDPPAQPASQQRQAPPPLPVRAAPPPPLPQPQAKPRQAPPPQPDFDWQEAGQDVFNRLVEKKKQADAMPPVPLPPVEDTQPFYSLDVEETSHDLNLGETHDTGAWFDNFDLDS